MTLTHVGRTLEHLFCFVATSTYSLKVMHSRDTGISMFAHYKGTECLHQQSHVPQLHFSLIKLMRWYTQSIYELWTTKDRLKHQACMYNFNKNTLYLVEAIKLLHRIDCLFALGARWVHPALFPACLIDDKLLRKA